MDGDEEEAPEQSNDNVNNQQAPILNKQFNDSINNVSEFNIFNRLVKQPQAAFESPRGEVQQQQPMQSRNEQSQQKQLTSQNQI